MKRILSGIMIFALSVMVTACGPKQNIPSSPTADAVAQNTVTTDASKVIGEEKAKEIALDKAEISSDGVRFDRVELDRDDGMWQYEVDFRHGNMEYDVDINAETGEVIGFEKEAL